MAAVGRGDHASSRSPRTQLAGGSTADRPSEVQKQGRAAADEGPAARSDYTPLVDSAPAAPPGLTLSQLRQDLARLLAADPSHAATAQAPAPLPSAANAAAEPLDLARAYLACVRELAAPLPTAPPSE